MKPFFCTTLTVAALLAAGSASASETPRYYAGAGMGSKGNMNIATSAGRFPATNSPRPFRIFGGVELTEHVGIEAGYVNFGGFKFGGAGEIDLAALQLMGKGSFKLSDNWTVFGKAGAVRHTVEVAVTGVPERTTHVVKPAFGIGVSYSITPKIRLEAEFADYGRVQTQNLNLRYRQLQLGVSYRF